MGVEEQLGDDGPGKATDQQSSGAARSVEQSSFVAARVDRAERDENRLFETGCS